MISLSIILPAKRQMLANQYTQQLYRYNIEFIIINEVTIDRTAYALGLSRKKLIIKNTV